MTVVWGYVLGQVYPPTLAEKFATLFHDEFWLSEAEYTTTHKIVLGMSARDLRTELEVNGHEIDFEDNKGQTALNWAAARGDAEKVAILLAYGANADIPMQDGITALINAAGARANPDAMLVLLNYGVNPNQFSLRGYTALHLVAGQGNGEDYVVPLLRAGCKPNQQSRVGSTAMSIAAAKGNVNCVKSLLENGANPEIPLYRDSFLTPLGLAVRENLYGVMEVLLDANVKWDRVGENGDGILHWAAKKSDIHGLDILTQKGLTGLNVSQKNAAGRTAQMLFERRPGVTEGLRQAWERFLDSVRRGSTAEDPEEFVDACEFQDTLCF
jgi:ankyrin repeat protein